MKTVTLVTPEEIEDQDKGRQEDIERQSGKGKVMIAEKRGPQPRRGGVSYHPYHASQKKQGETHHKGIVHERSRQREEK